ncbi:MAG TPA: fumarylacetoacetate hydrolase family protein [Casimicrobiaceae bacterium]
MTPDAIAQAAGLLADARRNGRRLDALPESCRPATLADAHAIQEATALRLGEAIAGWKVGATPEGGVARGALLRSWIYASGARVPAATVPLLGVEAEIAFRLDCDLPARNREYDYAEVAAAVTALPAIEIVDSRYQGYPNAPLLDRIADFMSNGAFIGGVAQPRWREFGLETIDVELTIDGRTLVRRSGGHPTGDPVLPAVALVNDLRGGSGTRAGQIVTTGTYTGLQYAKPGQTVAVTFKDFGSVEVRFAT